MKRRKSFFKGFTLIELLIVLVIISIAGGIAMFAIGHNQKTRYDAIAKQITSMLNLAEEEAMLKPAILALGFSNTTFQFYEYHDDVKKDENPWQPVSNKALGLHHIPNNVQITLKIHDKTIPPGVDNNSLRPQLIISTSGDIIPFTILIGKPNQAASYQVIGNADGSISHGPITQ